ncbi:hypothetical protein PMAC_001856 [Pneumocystis sp. 'macacae']|nr:hypothetical protein PMAC_001856 [Pneumocystis sp. 'macacae']
MVVLIVNVASKIVIAFPCNQFGSQEPGTYEEIIQFCSKEYNVTFPIMDKIDVNGPNSHPLYLFLKKQKSGCLGFSRIKWNFEKFLIDKHGNAIFYIYF